MGKGTASRLVSFPTDVKVVRLASSAKVVRQKIMYNVAINVKKVTSTGNALAVIYNFSAETNFSIFACSLLAFPPSAVVN